MTIRELGDVPSPCVSICKMNPVLGDADERATGGLCVGCLRTIDEIIEWGNASSERKREIVVVMQSRRSRRPPVG